MFANFASLSTLAVASLALLGQVNGATHSARRRHAGTSFLQNRETHVLEKRFDNARMTFYEAGLGACGKTNNDGDYVSQRFNRVLLNTLIH